MRKSMKTILAALALATPLALTSCEGALDDIFGEWDKPSATPTADHSKQYLVYSYSTALDSTWTDIGDATEWNIATGPVAAGTYVVSGDFTCTGQLVLKGDVNLILKDGAKLTVNDGIVYDVTNNVGSLNIYGQGISSSMGQVIVKNSTPDTNNEATAIFAKKIEIHGCLVNATGDFAATATNKGKGLEGLTSLKIFNGKIVALSTGHGIATADGDMFIYGGDIDAQTLSKSGAASIFVYGDNLTIAGGIVKANSASVAIFDAPGIKNEKVGGTITISGGTVTALGLLSQGIYSYIISIIGGTVVASNVGGGNPAIWARTSLTIDGSETQVTATGGNGRNGSTTYIGSQGGHGIYSPTIQINGGSVIAAGGNGGNGYTGGGDGGNGGDGIICTNIAVDASASVTATGGNGGNVKTGQAISGGTSMAGKGLDNTNPATGSGTITATDGTAGTASL